MKVKIFLDTIAFKAFINRSHPKHNSTVQAFEDFARLNVYLVSSSLVLADVHEYLLRHLSPTIAKDFVQLFPQMGITILRPSPKDEKTAIGLVAKPTAYDMRYRDALHIALLQRNHINRALSTNPHFGQHSIALLGN